MAQSSNVQLSSDDEREDVTQTCDTCFEEEDDGEPRICKACGDKATGYHFNVMTCEGCKGFFRRAMKRSIQFSCPFQNACVITKNNRRQCQACRLKKCLDIGMRKELIMSDVAVEQRRALIKKKKQVQEEQLPSAEPLLTPKQEKRISEILEAHRKTFDPTFSSFNHFRPINRSSSLTMETNKPSLSFNTEADGRNDTFVQRASLEKLSLTCHHNERATEKEEKSNCVDHKWQYNHTDSVFSMLPHVSDLSTYMIKGVINFAKQIRLFRSLTIEDQIALLKGATFEVCQIRFNTVFNKTAGVWECGHLTYSMDDAASAGFQHILLEPLLKFHYMLRKLELDDEEYVLMQAISLFSPDRPGVTEHQIIDNIQEELAIVLKTYVDAKHPEPAKKFLFPKMMGILTELRTMNAEYAKQVLQIQDIQPDVTPLMMELFGAPGE